jgi:hypothetical protein
MTTNPPEWPRWDQPTAPHLPYGPPAAPPPPGGWVPPEQWDAAVRPARRRIPRPLIVLFVVLAVFALAGVCGGILSTADGEVRPGRAAVPAAPSPRVTPSPTPTPTAETPKAAKPAPAPSATPTPEPVADPAAKPRRLTAREWSKVARSPDKYTGRAYIVYGHVTQFDTATGEDAFRANVDGVRHAETWEYDTNTILVNGGTADLSDLVDGDMFRAEVIVSGAFEYESAMGAQLTAPQLLVTKIRRY